MLSARAWIHMEEGFLTINYHHRISPIYHSITLWDAYVCFTYFNIVFTEGTQEHLMWEANR